MRINHGLERNIGNCEYFVTDVTDVTDKTAKRGRRHFQNICVPTRLWQRKVGQEHNIYFLGMRPYPAFIRHIRHIRHKEGKK